MATLIIPTDTSQATLGFLKADGTIIGSTSQAQDFGSTGIKTDVIAESTSAANITFSDSIQFSESVGVIFDASGDSRIRITDAGGLILSALAAGTITMTGAGVASDATSFTVGAGCVFGVLDTTIQFDSDNDTLIFGANVDALDFGSNTGVIEQNDAEVFRFKSGNGENFDLTGSMLIDGSEDIIQLRVQAHSTQTSDLVVFEQSDGTDVFTVSNAGLVTMPIAGGIANTLTDNVIHGEGAGASLVSGALRNTLIGNSAGNAMTDADDTVMIGDDAGLLCTVGGNVFVGSGAGAAVTTGTGNLMIGFKAGNAISTQANNIFIGSNAGLLTTDEKNVFIGAESGKANTTGSSNTFIGFKAGTKNVTNDQCLFVGEEAGANSIANRNLYIGVGAGQVVTTGASNVGIGFQAGRDNATGANCVFIGNDADVSGATNLNAVIALGAAATVTAANQMVIGSTGATISDAYIGSGVQDSTANTTTLQSTGGSGTDNAGADFVLGAGKPTGSATGGSLILSTAPAGATGTALRALVARLTIDSTGLVTIPGDAIVDSRDVLRYALLVGS